MNMNKKGFTLIELLIVVAIIAILAAIAIPQFGAYRARAVRASMVADSKNIATALETTFQDCSTYLVAADFTVTGPASADLAVAPLACIGNTITPGTIMVAASRGNQVDIPAASVTDSTWVMTVTNAGGNDTAYTGPITRDNTGSCVWSAPGNQGC